jgi:hypothetical protein
VQIGPGPARCVVRDNEHVGQRVVRIHRIELLNGALDLPCEIVRSR